MNLETTAAIILLTVAAYIDWKEHRVPNWLTYSALLCGLAFHVMTGGVAGLGFSLLGAFAGLATLIVLYALGGMGAGDVKLMAATGAWIGATATLQGFVWIAMIGGAMGAYSIYRSGQWRERAAVAQAAGVNLMTLRPMQDGVENAPERILLPYGVPIAFGFYAYFLIGSLLG